MAAQKNLHQTLITDFFFIEDPFFSFFTPYFSTKEVFREFKNNKKREKIFMKIHLKKRAELKK